MDQHDMITIQNDVAAPMETVWAYWTLPEHIVRWAFASDDWEAPDAENDLRIGGRFKTVMAAKDGSARFDFMGTYTDVALYARIEYDIDDGRHVRVVFEEIPVGVRIVQSFEPETENSEEVQRVGWQAILDTFKRYTEGNR